MITEQITQMIVLYAPTLLTAAGTILSFTKIFSGLKNNNKKIKTELEKTRELLAQQARDNAELKALNKELINEISKVRKYEDIRKN